MCSWLLILTQWFPDALASHWMRLVLPTDVSPWINTGRYLERDAIRNTTYTVLVQNKWAISGQRGELGLSIVLAVGTSISGSRSDQIRSDQTPEGMSLKSSLYFRLYVAQYLLSRRERMKSELCRIRSKSHNKYKKSFAQDVFRAFSSSTLK